MLIVSGLLALVRGFVKELLHILAWIGAAIAAIKLFPFAQPHVRSILQPDLLADLSTGAGIFIIALIVLSLVFAAIGRRVRESDIGMLDRSLGFLFGLARGALVLALAYLVLVQFLPPKDQPEFITEARSTPLIAEGAKLLASLAPEAFEATLQTLEEASERGVTAFEEGSFDAILRGGAAGKADGAAAGQDDSGYGSGERKDMDHLVRSKQKN